MFKNLSISKKITALVVVVVLFTVALISLLSYNYSKDAFEQRYSEALFALATGRAEKLDTYFEKVTSTLKLLQNAPALNQGLSEKSVDNGLESDTPVEEDDLFSFDLSAPVEATPAAGGEDVSNYIGLIKDNFEYTNIYITTPEGKIKYSTDPDKSAGANFIGPDGSLLKNALEKITFSSIEVLDSTYFIYAAAAITPEAGERSLAIIQMDLDKVSSLINSKSGFYQTTDLLLAKPDSVEGIVTLFNAISRTYRVEQINDQLPEFLDDAIADYEGISAGTDYNGNNVLAAWKDIPAGDWTLLATIQTSEVFGNNTRYLLQYILLGLLTTAIAVILALVFSRQLIKPIQGLKKSLSLLSNGILPKRVEKYSSDEIGDMAVITNNLVGTLRANADFAKTIGEGKFDANFNPVSHDDLLGNSLVTMRDNLILAEQAEKQRNWIITGVAEISNILRAHTELDKLGDDVIKYIVDKIDAVQGAFYVVNDDDEDDPQLEMMASYAYNRKKHLVARFKFAEGLVGQAAAEKDTVLRIEIPDDYVSVTSGILGDQKPSCILIVPLITNEKVYGALEFAGFERFDEAKVKFVEELSLSLARTIFNIKVNERTRKLLEESQAMSAELQEKQEVLRQNAEEMQATQEELKRSNTALEEQIEEVNRTQKRMQLLLENASEVITIYEEDETIRYISPSVEPILGYSQKEMIGSSDMDHVQEEHREHFHKMFTDLKANPLEQVTIQYEYKTKEGNYIWIESTGTNSLSNPAIQGFIINSRDITERRRAEQEQRMRSKMQSLSENSPDLIARIENEMISYINPVIEEYTGKKPLNYLNHPVKDVELNEKVLESWLDIVNQVSQSNQKLSTEMDFPSDTGDRIMQVNAIPEFDETDHLESVLVVSHDITERKLIELEIQNKNKKIADSINYAKRIQGAILPNTSLINKALPNSFILYKPKDVVSGDFPWYIRVGDIIYMAAVDCTGHGVPGALLSLIGYFLLNDIVRSRKIEDPGVILDQLDEGVTQTLRQDEDDSKTKDGMDIALCRIDLKSKEVQYAGAHRPLYAMVDGEMVEIKGNKFAIGGGIYKNQTNFETHTLQLKKNDSFYFCSDGFPDQFGGPQNRKFGPKRLRELITNIHAKDMSEAYAILDNEWETWKGDEKQTDDVLLIGIKF